MSAYANSLPSAVIPALSPIDAGSADAVVAAPAGAAFGLQAQKALNSVIGQSANPAPQAAFEPRQRALLGISANFNLIADPKTQGITRASLEKAASGALQIPGGSSAQNALLKESAQYFLDNPAAFDALETSNGRYNKNPAITGPDGNVSREDVATELAYENLTGRKTEKSRTLAPADEPYRAALEDISDNYGVLMGPDGFISGKAIEDAAKGIFPPGKDAALSKAQKDKLAASCKYLVDHPDQLSSLDSAQGTNLMVGLQKNPDHMNWAIADRIVSMGDLSAELSRQPLSSRDATTLKALSAELPGYLSGQASSKGKPGVVQYPLTREQLQAISSDQAATPALREAATALLDDPRLFRRLANAEQNANHLSNADFGRNAFSELDLMLLMNRPEMSPPPLDASQIAAPVIPAN